MFAFNAEQTAHVRVGGFQLFIHIGFGYAQLFGCDARKVHPFNNIKPLVIAMANGGRQWLFGNDFGQNDMVTHVRQLEPFRIKSGDICGEAVAPPGLIGFDRLFACGKRHHFQLHFVGAKIVGKVQLCCGTLIDTYRCTGQIQCRFGGEALFHHEALAIIVGNGSKVKAKGCVARRGPGNIARKNINFARLKRCKTGHG